MIHDRVVAGQLLAAKLERYRGANAVVLALPRGGVVVGHEIAKVLGLPLDIITVRKIGHPDNPEYAIGAVDEHGRLLCNEAERKLVNQDWLRQEIARQTSEAKRRVAAYRGARPPMEITGKVAIITDDGIATGLTMRLAVAAVKGQHPARVVVAVPVAPADIVGELAQEVDELIVLLPLEEFAGAVGAHYREFEQVTDETVIRLLGL